MKYCRSSTENYKAENDERVSFHSSIFSSLKGFCLFGGEKSVMENEMLTSI